MVKLAPSILAADFSCLEKEVNQVAEAGADWLHIDVMDGRFVPNLTFGPPVVASLRKKTEIFFDVHLMVDSPELYVDAFADAGADLITFHVEATSHAHRLTQLIRSKGLKVGAALNPATSLSALDYLWEELDLILIMSVNPGFGGQEFIPSALGKIAAVSGRVRGLGLSAEIQADGGINLRNYMQVVDAGATVLVAGSAVFGSRDSASAVHAFKTRPGKTAEI